MFSESVVFHPMERVELAAEVTVFFHGFAFDHVSGQFLFRVDKMGGVEDAHEFLVVFTH
jgi:hypothetical protein